MCFGGVHETTRAENDTQSHGEGRAMGCVTVETTAYSLASHQAARFRLVYEVTPFRDGLECWFLVVMEELQAAFAHNPVETEGVEASSLRG